MTNLVSKIRFLPITIFAAVLMLTVKIGNIWEGVDVMLNGSISVSDAVAQEKPQQPPPPKPNQPTAAAKPAAAKSSMVQLEEGSQPAPGRSGDDGKMAGDPSQAGLLSKDPTLLTQAEIDLLQKLAERRDVLDGRAKELDMRVALMKAAETRIDKKIRELKAIEKTIENLLAAHDQEQQKKTDKMVKIYQNMKPKDAARIFQELEINTLMLVVEKMSERKLAPIMAKMNPKKATEITVELARLRQLPSPGEEDGGG
jgi:flagellar motility protein MotE (MotC chaperone)